MPLYEFICQDCRHEQELLVRGKDSPQCESCGSSTLEKLFSVPAAPQASNEIAGNRPPEGSCGSGCGCFPG